MWVRKLFRGLVKFEGIGSNLNLYIFMNVGNMYIYINKKYLFKVLD